MDAFEESLAHSPELFPQDWDPGRDAVSLIRLSARDYEVASFLDGRLVAPSTPRRTVPWQQIEAAVAAAALPETCNYIFHIGHVGSTLLSRLLGGQSGTLQVREPAILRTLAQIRSDRSREPRGWAANDYERRLSSFLKLWSRTFAPGDRAVVKATSFVSEIAAELLTRNADSNAILMYVPAEIYLATILGAEHSPKEARVLASDRLARLQRRLAVELPPI